MYDAIERQITFRKHTRPNLRCKRMKRILCTYVTHTSPSCGCVLQHLVDLSNKDENIEMSDRGLIDIVDID